MTAREDGFTLIEVLAVMAIIALAAGIAIPSLVRPSDRLALAETAREMVAVLKLTRSAAITGNREALFVIDVEARRFGSPIAKERHFPGSVSVAFTVAEPERLSQHRGGIRFFPDGSSTGGELALSRDTRRTTICVHWLTGRAIEADTC